MMNFTASPTGTGSVSVRPSFGGESLATGSHLRPWRVITRPGRDIALNRFW